MARYRGKKKALYEVMSKSRLKPAYGKPVEPLHSQNSDKAGPSEFGRAMPEPTMQWRTKPRHVQFNADRIEISIPYQLAVALILGLILIALIAFRLGQLSRRVANSESLRPLSQAGRVDAAGMQPSVAVGRVATETAEAGPIEPQRNNRIVIQTYPIRAHLEPAKLYFAECGIETEIRKIGDWYYLVTKNKYNNPEKQGTNGYFARQKIVELGAKYQAPQGYETFGTKPFHDAYGMKFDD